MTPNEPSPGRWLLVLAGHDPTGGAGVDADRRAAQVLGVPAECVVTAETEQDGQHVQSVRARPAWPEEAQSWLRRGPAALKTGLLPGAQSVRCAAELASARGARPMVVDPVLAASGGEEFLAEEGIAVLRSELIAQGVVLTPNLPEAARLVGADVESLVSFECRLDAARALLELGAGAVLLKGGHGAEDPVRDMCWERHGEPQWLEHPRVPGAGIHGSGCRFASLLAAGLALGEPLAIAAKRAGEWVGAEIARSGSRANS